MKRIFLTVLSCLVIVQAQAGDFVSLTSNLAYGLAECTVWTAVGTASVLAGARLGTVIGENLADQFAYERSTIQGFYTDMCVGGLVGWGTTFVAKKLLTSDSAASSVGLVVGLVAAGV